MGTKYGGQWSADHDLTVAPLVSSFHMAVSGASLKAVPGVPSFLWAETPLVPPCKYEGRGKLRHLTFTPLSLLELRGLVLEA